MIKKTFIFLISAGLIYYSYETIKRIYFLPKNEDHEISMMDELKKYFMDKKKKFLKTFKQPPPQKDIIKKTENSNIALLLLPYNISKFFYKIILPLKNIEKEVGVLNEKKEDETVNENIEKCLYDSEWYSGKYNTNSEIEWKEKIKKENEIEESWKRRVMFESTPLGNVIMYYDVYKNGFAYYSNHSLMDYFLNGLAMKYVLIFKCRDFFMDEKLSPIPSPLIKIKEEGEKKTNNEEGQSHRNVYSDNSVFVKAKIPEIEKKIEKNRVIPANAPPKYLFQKYFTYFKDPQPKEKVPEPVLSKNKFIRVGKIEDFSFIQKPKKKSVFAQTKTNFDVLFEKQHTVQRYTFSDYKKKKETEKQMSTPVTENGSYLTYFEER